VHIEGFYQVIDSEVSVKIQKFHRAVLFYCLQRCEKRQTHWNLTLFSGSLLPSLVVAYQLIWILSSDSSRTSGSLSTTH